MSTSQPHAHNDDHPMKLVGQVFRSFAKLVDTPLRDAGMAFSQLPVLVTLKKAGALPQSELTRIAQVEQSSMAQLLARMERDGLINRTPDPADGRSRLIALTPRASRQLPAGKAIMDDACTTALQGFSEKEQALLLQLLQRAQQNLERALSDGH